MTINSFAKDSVLALLNIHAASFAFNVFFFRCEVEVFSISIASYSNLLFYLSYVFNNWSIQFVLDFLKFCRDCIN